MVRLKSGDPLVFGRAGEEMQALRDAGVAYEVVPGVTAAFAAAADFELPLTLRGVSSSHGIHHRPRSAGETLPDWARLAIDGATVAVYMGRSIAAEVAARLIEAGLSPDTAVAVVENASRAGPAAVPRHAHDLPSLEARSDLTGPVMTIIGDAVAGANFANPKPSPADAVPAARAQAAEGGSAHEVLTANRLTDGEAVWFSADQRWSETHRRRRDRRMTGRRGAARSIGKAAFDNNEVVDVNLIDVALVDGAIRPLRLREHIRAAGPTNRIDLGKQARTAGNAAEAAGRTARKDRHVSLR